MNAPLPVAWHYTIGLKLEAILKDGFIRQATAGVPKGERPVVWLSQHPVFEPTARKLFVTPDGSARIVSVEENARLGGGLVRIGYPLCDLVPWPEIGVRAGIGRAMRRRLETIAIRQGATPAHWWGSLEPLAVNAGVVEVMNSSGRWIAWGRYMEVVA